MNDASNLCVLADDWIIETESAGDASARELLLDRVMGPDRFLKSSERLRQGRTPSGMLSIVARHRSGRMIGTVRLWDILAGDIPSLLLGPLAVDRSASGKGVGTALMQEAISRARAIGHGSIILVGDPGYYERFGFSDKPAARLSMPGEFDRTRLQAMEMIAGHLEGARGMISVNDHALPMAA